jgi:lactate dehydrogenase-like 2-hydroxyacid dehydrogenase
MAIYFNTKTFDNYTRDSGLPITRKPEETLFLVLGSKRPDYRQFSKLKAIYRFGVGIENIDFDFIQKRGIALHFPSDQTKEVLYEATANFTVYGILYMLMWDAFGRVDGWCKMQREYIGAKRGLIIGTGHIGSRVKRKLIPFFTTDTFDIRFNSLEELEGLVRGADVISIHIPLTDDTAGFFNREKLSWVKDDALLVNTARGNLFDEDALYEKISSTNCRAFFDVFWEEPYQGKLKSLGKKRFFMTPHSSSNTREFLSAGYVDILRIWENVKNA